MDSALRMLGVDPSSGAFGFGKFAGEAAGVAGMPVARGGGLLTDVAKNALSGAVAAGVIDPKDIGTGGAVGGGLTLVGRPAAVAGRWVKDEFLDPALDLMRKGGEENIVRKYLTRMIGEANVPATVQAARQGVGFTPGYQPKTVETMVKYVKNPTTGKKELVFISEGSPLSKITEIEAKQPGGASAQFGRILSAQDDALLKAEKARDMATAPLRQTSTRSANMAGGVDAGPIQARLQSMRADPSNYGAPGVRGVLDDIRSDLDVIVSNSPNGRYVDAEAIYELRKDLNKRIGAIAQAKNVTFDKGKAAKLETELKKAIDEGMNDALAMSGMPPSGSGKTVWDRYLEKYSKASESIRLDRERRELAKSPPQPTSITGGRDVAGEATPQAANVLSRPIMMTNWTLRLFGKSKEPQVDELLTRVLQNPADYERLMAGVKPTARAQVKIAMDLLRNTSIAAVASE
jgi:hypothetical protein